MQVGFQLAAVQRAAEDAGLFLAGGLHPSEGDTAGGTVYLLGAAAEFWAALQGAPEWSGPDPVDTYSTRVVTALAEQFGAQAVFPFGGPPWAPFFTWALGTEHAWQSPVGMLVQARAGLMISYRGALTFADALPLPARAENPCPTCSAPCLGACPVDALSRENGYDVPACKAFLDTPEGADCLSNGCKARRACPVSHSFGRDPAQSAHHMSYFHP